jgi:hypothetical protein
MVAGPSEQLMEPVPPRSGFALRLLVKMERKIVNVLMERSGEERRIEKAVSTSRLGR